MTESHPEQSDDKFGLLGLTVISRHEAKGLEEASRNFHAVAKKIRIVQLITAVALLFFLNTDMLPFAPVIVSGASVFFTALFVGKKALRASVDEAKRILATVEFGDNHDSVKETVSDPNFAKEIVHSGLFLLGDAEVINVDGDYLVLCRKTEQLTA